jgi:muramoyltetrapeptide carboxypeptidase
MKQAPASLKARALHPGSRFAPIALASPAPPERIAAGQRELERLGFSVGPRSAMQPDGYFAGRTELRRAEFLLALEDPGADALIAARGGYGSAYLLDPPLPPTLSPVKALIGFSDLTTLQIYLWRTHRWITFYGPMLAAGLDAGSAAPNGYEPQSFRSALMKTDGGWTVALDGVSLSPGQAEGVLLGGAMTLVEATLGTPWELDTAGCILVLEDRAMKPYQIDRVLLHLKQAGKLNQVRGIVLGDFPDCEPPVAGSPSVRDRAAHLLGPLGIPVVFGAPIGHTRRPMLTLPLGVRARLTAAGGGKLEILEPAVVP